MLTASWCVHSETAAARPLLTITESPLGTPHASLVPTRPRLTLPPRPLPFAQVKPEHVEAYRRNAPMYVDEEAERATRWDAFLAQKDDNGNDDDDARDGARTLDALVRVLDARAARGSGDDASEESDDASCAPRRGVCPWRSGDDAADLRASQGGDAWRFPDSSPRSAGIGSFGNEGSEGGRERGREDAVERAGLLGRRDAQLCGCEPRTAVRDDMPIYAAQLAPILRFVASGNKSTRIPRTFPHRSWTIKDALRFRRLRPPNPAVGTAARTFRRAAHC